MKARGKNVVVRQHLSEDKSKGGIILTEQRPLPEGTVVLVGPEVEDLAEGDVVCFSHLVGNHLRVEDEDYLILESDDILLVLNEEEE